MSKVKVEINVTWLVLLFIMLKLTHVINWSWVWVLSPIWIGLSILVVIGIIWYKSDS